MANLIECPTHEIFESTVKSLNLKVPVCRICGRPIWYHNNIIRIKSKGFDIIGKPNAFSTKKYDKEYSITICEDCLMEEYPELREKKNTISYYNGGMDSIRFGYEIPKDIFDKINAERYGVTKEKLIKLHGNEIGTQKWNDYCRKQKETNEFEYKKEKYGWTEEQFEDYNKSRACTLKNFIKRYGEKEGQKKWNEYCERQRETCSKAYWIEKLGPEEGIKHFEFTRKALFDNMKYLETTSKPYSKIGTEAFNSLSKYFPNNRIFYEDRENKKEEWFFSKEGHFYKIDYFDLDLKIGVEFYGDFWHMNPNKYKETNIRKVGSTTLSAKQIWDRDKERLEIIESSGIKMFVIWESDYKSNKETSIKELADKINNFIKTKN